MEIRLAWLAVEAARRFGGWWNTASELHFAYLAVWLMYGMWWALYALHRQAMERWKQSSAEWHWSCTSGAMRKMAGVSMVDEELASYGAFKKETKH